MTVGIRENAELTQDERDRFERDGLLVLDQPCSIELVDAVREKSDVLYRDAFDEGPDTTRDGAVYSRHAGGTERYHWHRIRDAWKPIASVREMALSPRILAAIGELYGRAPLPFQTLNFPMGTEQHAHIDAFYFDSDPPGYMCGVWIALEDMDMDNGPLVYYPGSHKIPLPAWDEISDITGIATDPDSYPGPAEMMDARNRAFAGYCHAIIERHDLTPEYGTIRKGQALIWAANLLHGGSPQRDKSRTRHSQVTHYYFEGTRHRRPFQAYGDYVFYSYPEWIREPPPDTSIETLREVVQENVPAGSTILIAGSGYEELLQLEDRQAQPFPRANDGTPAALAAVGSGTAVSQLAQQISEGAEYIIFPKGHLAWLEYQPVLQDYLEHEQRAVFRDGAYCAIYALAQS
jgi:ectoine hydroxylase-related dioxygenase (phytanoyl-CoA dioxygenase family)